MKDMINKEFHHGNDHETRQRLEREAAQFKKPPISTKPDIQQPLHLESRASTFTIMFMKRFSQSSTRRPSPQKSFTPLFPSMNATTLLLSITVSPPYP
jgi:hypothetical protein